ncbi:MAG: deoxynucleoside kinase [Bacteroidota bacterium]
MYNFVVIEGNIGAGKTSLAKKLTAQYSARLILERFADNPFLPKFYKDPLRYSFPLELSFLAERYNQLKNELSSYYLFNNLIIADYFFMKSLIFARQTLPEDEFKLYRQLFDIIYNSLPKPDLYIYLYVDTEKLMGNIAKRGRSYEKKISHEYLNKINQGYFDFFKQQTKIKILVININGIDFVNNKNDYNKIHNAIFKSNYHYGLNTVKL